MQKAELETQKTDECRKQNQERRNEEVLILHPAFLILASYFFASGDHPPGSLGMEATIRIEAVSSSNCNQGRNQATAL